MGTTPRSVAHGTDDCHAQRKKHLFSNHPRVYRSHQSITMPYDDAVLEAKFAEFDKDGSGFVVKSEIKNVILALGLSEEDASKIAANCMEDGDADGNAKMTLQEFKDFMNAS